MATSFMGSPLIMKTVDCSFNSRAVGLCPGIIMSPALSNTSKQSLVIRAQRYDGEPRRDHHLCKKFEPNRMKDFFDTYRLGSTPVKMEEKSDATEIWVKMPGVGVMDIHVYVKNNKLYIQERNDISPFRRMTIQGIQPFERIELPLDSKTDDITAMLGNGILYICVPKVTKPELPYDIPVQNVSW